MTKYSFIHLTIVFALLFCHIQPLGADMQSNKYTNRLSQEKSPYLLQHAHNPVDWYAWNEEAFEKARKEDKPIFLSVGYSTCHWCHVMEKESFENEAIAQILNDHFVSIKVDREERPDVDQVYMQAVMAMSGSGGWPMSVFLTPDLKPFYGGTYFPPEDKWGKPGFATVLRSISDKWKEDRGVLLKSSEEISEFLKAQTQNKTEESKELTEDVLKKAFHQYESQYDAELGGFGPAPKFPRTPIVSFLLRYWKREGDVKAIEMSERTLQMMALGGMYDHLGGGFHRYSTDKKWHIPHFEKMLYDQALISKTYLEAYQATQNSFYADVVGDIFNYVLREMTSSEGGFYSAEDADSAADEDKPEDKTEGAFYVWEESEIKKALGKKNAEIFNFAFGVLPGGNAEVDPHGDFKDKNTLYVANLVEGVAKKFDRTEPEILEILKSGRKKLFEQRRERLRPYLDDKVLTDWNGLMISSLAFGSRVLGDDNYKQAAMKAADFILDKLVTPEGRLLHRYRDGESGITGFIEDYAFFIYGLLDLYEATFEVRYLKEAIRLAQEMKRLFWDKEKGGFFFTASDAEQLISPMKEIYDGAIPSGNSMATLVLLRLNRMTMESDWNEDALKTLSAFSSEIERMPSGYPQMLIALDFSLGPNREVVLAAESAKDVQPMVDELFGSFLPNKVVLFHSDKESKIEEVVPFIEGYLPMGGKPTAYVCQNFACQLPTTELTSFKQLLKK